MDKQYELYTIFTYEPDTTSDWTSAPSIDEGFRDQQPFFTESFAFNLVILVINFSIIFFNGIVIYIVARYREMRNTVTLCFMNLAITDIFYILAQTSYPLKKTTGFDLRTVIPCNILTYLHFASISATGLTMTFLAFDRYQVISSPLVNLKNRSYTKVMLSFVAIWTSSFALYSYIPVIHIDVGHHYCKNVYPNVGEEAGEKIFHTVKALTNYVFPVVVSSIFYIRIYLILRRSPPGSDKSSGAAVCNALHSLRSRRLRGLRVAVMVLILYTVCYLPATTLTVWKAWDPAFPTERFYEYHFVTGLLAKVCIFFNPFVYALSAQSFQAKLRTALCCCLACFRLKTAGANHDSNNAVLLKITQHKTTFANDICNTT